MSPLLIVATVGILVLLGLAILNGVRERAARAAAWARIGDKHQSLIERERALHEQRRELLAWESALADESEARRTE